MTDTAIDVSIVIVNWNTADMLCECLESVFAGLAGVAEEVIVVDNGSSDGSPERVRARFPSAILIANSANAGFAAANNQAIKVAKGRHVLLLNSDTLALRDVIARSVRYLDSNPEVGAMGCRALNTDGTLQPTCSSYPTVVNLALLTSGLWKLPWPRFFDRYQMRRWDRTDEREVGVISGCYLMVRGEVVAQIGLLDEDFFFFGEETDWCRRIKDAGWKLRFAPVGEIVHHGGGSVRRLSYQRDLMLSSAMVKLHLKHGGRAKAAVVLGLVCAFNFSRAAFWTIASVLSPQASSRQRRDHFVALARNSGRIWPRGKTWRFDDR